MLNAYAQLATDGKTAPEWTSEITIDSSSDGNQNGSIETKKQVRYLAQ